MKKLKLFALAFAALCTTTVWATSPDYESYDWSETDVAAEVGTHGTVTISTSGLGDPGNVSGHWYIPINQNLKNSDSPWKYFGVAATSQIDSISILYCPNGSNATSIAWVAWGENVTPNQYTIGHGVTAGTTSSKSWESAIWETINLSGITAYTVYLSRSIREFRETGATSNLSNFGGGQTINVLGIRVWLKPTCEEPAMALSLEADKTTDVYAGDVITFTTAGGNGSAIKLYDGDTEITSPWTATAGEHSFTAVQEVNEGVCGAITEAIVINVGTTTPVTAVTVAGPDNGYIGQEITLTATAENATQYRWIDTDGSIIPGETAATYTFTPDAAGTWKRACHARNSFNAADEWIPSEIKIIEVTKLCGELIKAETNGTVTGVVGGTIDTNLGTGDSKKLDKNKYYGVQISSGFQAADVFHMYITTVAGETMGTMKVYADAAGTQLLYESENIGVAGDNEWVLPSTVNGKTALYVYRGDGNDWNPTFSSISVTRSCTESDDNTIASLSVNGEDVTAENDVFAYTVSVSDDASEVEVLYELNHPLATAIPASGFKVAVPAAGDPANTQVITVTAENGGQKTYTVSVSKAAALSDDTTLKALAVEGYTLDPAFAPDVFYYEIQRPYSASNPAISAVTATPNHASATAAVELTTTEGEDWFEITVTAEDGTNKGYYHIHIAIQAAKKDLLEVNFSNGAKGALVIPEPMSGDPSMIRVPYLAGEATPTFVSATFWNPDGEPTAEYVANTGIVVTGADGWTTTYEIDYVALTPSAAVNEDITFDGSETSYIFAPYGFSNTKGWKFAKSVEEATNHRVSSGNSRIYMALPAADEVVLTSASDVDARPVKIYVNGVLSSLDKTAKKNESVTLPLNNDVPNFVAIESNQDKGDGGFSAIRLNKSSNPPTQLEGLEAEGKAVKVVRNGQVIILRDGKAFNVLGTEMK